MTNHDHNNFGIIRLALATLVVFGHFKTLPGLSLPTGLHAYADFAVDAFFVVSGYLIYMSFDRQPAMGGFYIRRILRIYPLYFVTVLAQGLGMALIAGGILPHASELARYLGFNFVMANFMAHDMDGLLTRLHNPGINPSLWTLKIEVGFYLILPFLWMLVRRMGNGVFVAIYALSTLFAILALHYGAPEYARQLPGQLRFFVVGMALYHFRDAIAISKPAAMAAVLLLFGVCSMRSEHIPAFIVFYPVCVGLLVFLCALRLPVMAITFDISYGVYLFHGPLIQFSLLLGLFHDTTGFLLGLLAVTYLLAFMAERLVEQPGIELGKRLARRWTARKLMARQV